MGNDNVGFKDPTGTVYGIRRLDTDSGDDKENTPVFALSDADGNAISANFPLAVNGASVFSKDIDTPNSDIGDFSGVVTDLFDSRTSTITSSEDSPSITVALLRPINNQEITLITASGDFRNATAVVKSAAGTVLDTDDTIAADATPRTEYRFVFPDTEKWCILELSFATTEDVTIGFICATKAIHVISHAHAFTHDGLLIPLLATNAGNQRFSLEEYEDAFNADPLPVTITDPAGTERKVEFDPIFKAPLGITIEHHEVHEGDTY
jgi:hypothetical protein